MWLVPTVVRGLWRPQDLVSVVSSNHDYPGIRRSLLNRADEVRREVMWMDSKDHRFNAMDDDPDRSPPRNCSAASTKRQPAAVDYGRRVRALIFDYDGLMIDSERVLAESVVDIITERGGRAVSWG